MTKVEQHLRNKIAAASEVFTKEELEAAKKDLPKDAETLMAIHSRISAEFTYLVEASIIEGLAGHVEQSVLFHKLSFQCLQINGMLMERARGEGTNEYYMTARSGQ